MNNEIEDLDEIQRNIQEEINEKGYLNFLKSYQANLSSFLADCGIKAINAKTLAKLARGGDKNGTR